MDDHMNEYTKYTSILLKYIRNPLKTFSLEVNVAKYSVYIQPVYLNIFIGQIEIKNINVENVHFHC